MVYVCHCVFLYLCALSVQDGKKYDGPGNESVPASDAGHSCGGGGRRNPWTGCEAMGPVCAVYRVGLLFSFGIRT